MVDPVPQEAGATPAARQLSPGVRLALDYGPLIAFFAVNFLVPGLPVVRLMAATVAFIVGIAIAIGYSLAKTGKVSPMLMLTGVLVLVFGGLTLWFHDPRFIQMKPTIIYALLALLLAFGLITGRPLLQQVLGTAYPGLSELGWRKLTVNWMIFFVLLAGLNEIVRHYFSLDIWVGFKVWGVIPLTFLFALANLPMLLKHGLDTGEPTPEP